MQPSPSARLSVAPLVSKPAADSTPPPPVAMPRERRPTWASLAILAAVTGVAAVMLGAWVAFGADANSPSGPTAREVALEQAVSILTSPGVSTIPFSASAGKLVLVVGERGRAVLSLNGIARAPAGRAYQAWIKPSGSAKASPAALFDGSWRFIPLNRPVARGAQVSVTLENEAGAATPSRVPRLTAVRP